DDVLDPARPRVVQGATAERGVSGAKDHGAVHRVGIVDDAFAQGCDADIGHRQDQAVDHFRAWRPGRLARHLLGLTILPDVKTPSGFAAELALANFVAQPRWRRRQQVAEFRTQHIADVETNVEPDLI